MSFLEDTLWILFELLTPYFICSFIIFPIIFISRLFITFCLSIGVKRNIIYLLFSSSIFTFLFSFLFTIDVLFLGMNDIITLILLSIFFVYWIIVEYLFNKFCRKNKEYKIINVILSNLFVLFLICILIIILKIVYNYYTISLLLYY